MRLFIALLLAVGCVLVLGKAPTGIEIAPGVLLPYVNLGTGSGQKGNVSDAVRLWFEAGGVGIDTARDYMDEAQIASGLAAAGAAAAKAFITTKIPCTGYA